MDELAKVNAELIIALKKINSMGLIIADLKAKTHSNTSSTTPTMGHTHYCWSCGFKSPHPSYKCDAKKEGRQDKATKYNIMNDCKTNHKA